MRAGGEVYWLQQAVEACSKSAVAYKAAFMLATDPEREQPLLDRCTERYALLEELLGVLGAHDVDPQRLREALEQAGADPSHYESLDAALADAHAGDLAVSGALEPLLGAGRLPAALKSFVASGPAEHARAEPARKHGASQKLSRAAELSAALFNPSAPVAC
jgi:hypothetical protein